MIEKDERVCEVLRKVCKAKGERGTWESHWTEIAELVLPAYSDAFLGVDRGTTGGEKKNQYMFDSTAPAALTRFASVMESILTPRQQTWHSLRPIDPYLLKDRPTQLWFEEANNLVFRYRYGPKANYASQQYEVYMSLGAFGTGAMFIDKLAELPGIRYRTAPLEELFFEENHQGVIDTVYRIFCMNGRQLLQKFKDLPKEVNEEYEKNDDKEYDVVHCVRPRSDVDYERLDYKGMPYESLYICKKFNIILAEGGYKSMPYVVSRYITIPGETYGRSPAMQVLPAIKTINEQKKTVLKQGHRIVDPVLLAYDDGVLDSFSMKPGAINYGGMSADGRRLVDTLPTGNLAIARDMMEDERNAINEAFLITLFQILVETPQMTATEVLERAREKAALLAPIMGRQQTEALGPMIEREVDLLVQQKLLPPQTPAMREANVGYKVEFDSPLSRMQKSEAAAGGLRMFQYAAEIAAQTQDPSSLDWFNVDEMVPALAQAQAMPASWMRGKEEVAQVREGRKQEQATQQMIEAAPSMASMMKATQDR